MARSVRINVTIQPDIADRLDAIAKKEKRTLSNMTSIAIEKYCDLYERRAKKATTKAIEKETAE